MRNASNAYSEGNNGNLRNANNAYSESNNGNLRNANNAYSESNNKCSYTALYIIDNNRWDNGKKVAILNVKQ